MEISRTRYIVGWIVSLIAAIIFFIVYRNLVPYEDILIVFLLSLAVLAIAILLANILIIILALRAEGYI